MKLTSPDAVVAKCRTLCAARGSPTYARNMRRYFKDVVELHGLRAPAVDLVYKDVVKLAKASEWDEEKVFATGLALLACSFQEEKRLGILFLKDRSAAWGVDHVDRIATAIDAHVYDWATSDTLSGVLRRVIENDSTVVPRMVAWSEAPSLWRRRASCVSFLSFAKKGVYVEEIETICDKALRMNERFVQLGAGWLLRELSCYDRDRTVEFLREHFEWTSREGLRYALEKMPNKLRKQLLDEHTEHKQK